VLQLENATTIGDTQDAGTTSSSSPVRTSSTGTVSVSTSGEASRTGVRNCLSFLQVHATSAHSECKKIRMSKWHGTNDIRNAWGSHQDVNFATSYYRNRKRLVMFEPVKVE